MNQPAFWKPVGVSLLITPVALVLAVLSGGAGHGDYLWARLLFPYAMLTALAFGSITTPGILLAILQFPLYGIALGIANKRHSFLIAAVGLLVVHILALVLVLLLDDGSFS